MIKRQVGNVFVWALRTKGGSLVGDPYPLGKRSRMLPAWWPTQSEALAAAGHFEQEDLLPVRIQICWGKG